MMLPPRTGLQGRLRDSALDTPRELARERAQARTLQELPGRARRLANWTITRSVSMNASVPALAAHVRRRATGVSESGRHSACVVRRTPARIRVRGVSDRTWLGPVAITLVAAVAPFLGSCADWPGPPRTREVVVVDTLHGVEVPDAYRWLEEQDAPEVREWIARQNAYARRVVSNPELETRIRERLTELMDLPDVGSPRSAAGEEIFTMRRSGEGQAKIYIRPGPPAASEGSAPPEDAQSSEPDPDLEYEILVDPASYGDDAVSASIVDISDDGRHMLYSGRDGGPDEISIRLYDIAGRARLPDSLPRALYGSVGFSGDGEGFYYVHRSRIEGPRVRYHRIGSSTDEDEEIWGEGYGPTTFLSVREIADGRYLQLGAQHGWVRNDLFVMERSTGEIHTIIEGEEAHVNARYEDGRLLLRTDLDAPYYRILAVPMAGLAPERWSDRANWHEVLPEAGDFLRSYTKIGDRYYATYLADVNTQILVFEEPTRGGVWRRVGRVRVPQYHTGSLRASGDGAVLTLSGYDLPATEYKLDLESFAQELIEPSEVPFDGSQFTVEQVFYSGKDGTPSTMFVVRRSDLAPDGNLPVLLHGYGGFNVSLTPGFRASVGVWLEHGGVYAVATLRGGSEYGERWHRGGMLANKQNVFDDFIAAAEWLIDNHYTNPGRLAITGSSNGGLLVASAFTQRPELFRAVFCGFPDLDMVRFHTFADTNNLPALLEYGDASDPEQFAFLHAYSPYQAVRDGVQYPAVMLTQGDLDTRVPPLQARKMTARLQDATASGLPVILRYDDRAGHAGGRPRQKVIADLAMELTFLMMMLGMDQAELEPVVADDA